MQKTVNKNLIALLADGEFHSGEAIGEVLQVSRAAVWKKLQGLDAVGLSVESVRGRGYRLAAPMSLFNEDTLLEMASQQGIRIQCLSEADSTNAEALRSIECGKAQAGDVFLAEQQSAGRGRRGKQWQSPYGANFYFSMYWPFEKGATQIEGLSLVVGLALQQSLVGLGYEGLQVKWPNDVLVSGKKLAGILLEITGDPTDVCHVVIGVGVNVNMRDSGGAIDQPWTSLQLLRSGCVDKAELLERFLLQLRQDLSLFERQGFSAFEERWRQVDALKGFELTLQRGNEQIIGEGAGVNSKGELLIRTAWGEEVFNGGEVSVRKRGI